MNGGGSVIHWIIDDVIVCKQTIYILLKYSQVNISFGVPHHGSIYFASRNGWLSF